MFFFFTNMEKYRLNVSVSGDEATISIVEFPNFIVGPDGHWHLD